MTSPGSTSSPNLGADTSDAETARANKPPSETETQCARIELAPGSYDRVKSWAREIRRRRTEAIATLLQEGVTVESVFYEKLDGKEYLVYYMRAADMNHAIAMGGKLTDDLQRYHNEFKRDVWRNSSDLELVLDLEVLADDLPPAEAADKPEAV